MATRQRPGQTGEASYGSRTLTIHDVPTEEQRDDVPAGQGDDGNVGPSQGVLRLRGGGNTRRVVWSEETVDNEGMGKKKSKICCIYHKPKAFDESSGESSSSGSSSDSDSDSDASTSAHSDDVNASKALREKRAAAAANGKAKERSRQEQANGVDDNTDSHDHCDHQHKHGKDRAKKAAIKKSGKPHGGRTVTIIEPAREEPIPQHPDQHSHDPGSGDPRHPLPNAYERGPS